jgi:Bacterial antitoxin of ParD toxin-antitoxin type II system and RHH
MFIDAEGAMPSSYTLGARFEAFVKELVASGRYNSASEVGRDGFATMRPERAIFAIPGSFPRAAAPTCLAPLGPLFFRG